MIYKYRDQFKRAITSFHHQIVFDPLSQMQCCLTPLPRDMKLENHTYLGTIESDSEIVRKRASFQIHPFTGEETGLHIPEGYSHLRFVGLRNMKPRGSLLSYFDVTSMSVSSHVKSVITPTRRKVESKEKEEKKVVL